MYDPLGRCVKITETTAGSVTSTKQFVWCDAQRCEERDGSGSLSNGKQFFGLGQVNFASGTPTNYFYTLDHLGSVREMTKTVSGTTTIEAQYDYSPWGEVTKLQGSADSDFQYAGYYKHARSGLNLTLYRAYNPGLGRWISRDPLGESAGVNLYGYVGNNPIRRKDPRGAQGVETLRLIPGFPLAQAGLATGGIIALPVGIADILSGRPGRAILEGWGVLTGSGGWLNDGTWSQCNAKNGAASPEDLIGQPETAPLDGGKKGYSRPGGMQGAVDDANALGPNDWRPISTTYGPGMVGDLPNEPGKVIIRPGNSENPTQPTVEIQRPNAKPVKLRY